MEKQMAVKVRCISNIFFMFVCVVVFAEEGNNTNFTLITGPQGFSPDAYYAANELAKRKGSEEKKPVTITHVIYSDKDIGNPTSMSELLVSSVRKQPGGTVIVCPAMMGTTDAFNKIKAIYPKTRCIAINPVEDHMRIAAIADIVISQDIVGQIFSLIKSSKGLGIKCICIKRTGDQLAEVEWDTIMRVADLAGKNLGLEIKYLKSGDNLNLEDIVKYKVGNNTKMVFYTTVIPNNFKDIQFVVQEKAYFLINPKSSLNTLYPKLLDYGIDSTAEINYQKILNIAEKKVIDQSLEGQLGVTIFPMEYVMIKGLVSYLKTVQGINWFTNFEEGLDQEITKNCIGAKFSLLPKTDHRTGVKARNHWLFREDIYIFGKGFMQTINDPIPIEYYKLNIDD